MRGNVRDLAAANAAREARLREANGLNRVGAQALELLRRAVAEEDAAHGDDVPDTSRLAEARAIVAAADALTTAA